MGVLDHEHDRAVAPQDLEQARDGRVKAVALGVGIAGDRRCPRRLGRKGRHQAPELRGTGPERGGQLAGVDDVGQSLERLGKRAVRRLHDRVARAVGDERAVGRRIGRELTYQPALARAGLPAEQHDPQALPRRPREQRPQLLQLGRAADERKRRGKAKRSWQVVHVCAPATTIVRSDHRCHIFWPSRRSRMDQAGS